jgi:hypothetical protein
MHPGTADQRADQLWLISGTGEGPPLARALLERGWRVRVCVVGSGAALTYPPDPRLELRVGALGGPADLAQEQAPERIKVIDRPVQPSAPTKPMPMLFAIVGLIAGIALGAGLAALLEIANTSVRRIRDLEKMTGLPVLARIPRFPAAQR